MLIHGFSLSCFVSLGRVRHSAQISYLKRTLVKHSHNVQNLQNLYLLISIQKGVFFFFSLNLTFEFKVKCLYSVD